MYCLWSANKDNNELLSISHMIMIHDIIHRVDIRLYNDIIKVTEIISNVNYLTDKLLQGNENNENSDDLESKDISTLKKFEIDKEMDKNDEIGNDILEILLEKAQNVGSLLNKEEAGILYLFPFPIFSQLYGTATEVGTGIRAWLSKAHGGANDDDKDSYLSSIISLLFIMSMTKDVLRNQSIPLSNSSPGPGSVSGYPSGPPRPISNNASIATSLILRAVCCGSERSKIAVLSCILNIAHIVRPSNILFTTTLDEYGDANCCDLVSSFFCDDKFTMPYWLDGERGGGINNGGGGTHRPTVVLADEIFYMIITALATPAFVQGLFLFCIFLSNNGDQDKEQNEQVSRSEENGDKAEGKKGVNKDMKRENCTRVKNLSIALLDPLLGFIVHEWDMKKIVRSDSVSTTIDNDNEMNLSMSSWSHILPFIKLLEWNQCFNLYNSKPLPSMITSFVQVFMIIF